MTLQRKMDQIYLSLEENVRKRCQVSGQSFEKALGLFRLMFNPGVSQAFVDTSVE